MKIVDRIFEVFSAVCLLVISGYMVFAAVFPQAGRAVLGYPAGVGAWEQFELDAVNRVIVGLFGFLLVLCVGIVGSSRKAARKPD